MADFATAYAPLAGFEGGWCNVQGDSGGETYAGIARRYWPGWPGWKIIKAQHKQLDESITRLSEVYASKTAVHRAHKRLDELDAVTADHAERLARLEAMQEIKRDCSCER